MEILCWKKSVWVLILINVDIKIMVIIKIIIYLVPTCYWVTRGGKYIYIYIYILVQEGGDILIQPIKDQFSAIILLIRPFKQTSCEKCRTRVETRKWISSANNLNLNTILESCIELKYSNKLKPIYHRECKGEILVKAEFSSFKFYSTFNFIYHVLFKSISFL